MRRREFVLQVEGNTTCRAIFSISGSGNASCRTRKASSCRTDRRARGGVGGRARLGQSRSRKQFEAVGELVPAGGRQRGPILPHSHRPPCARDHSLQCNWMQRDMNEHEEIAKALKARVSELRTHLVKVDRELHKPLPADSEDQAIELENQEALEVIKKTETTEIHQIEAALKRISEGTYGVCAKC